MTESETPATNPPAKPAGLGVWCLPLILGTFWCVADQLTKFWVVQTMELGEAIVLWEGFFALHHVRNEGAAFSLLSGARWLLVSLAFVALAALWFFRAHLGLERRLYRIAIGLILGGILGNLIDRILLGYVVDFLDFVIPVIDYPWPTFNVADIGIVCGVFLYISLNLVLPAGPSTAGKSTPADAAPPPTSTG
ncbi:MAG: signal peptidase II [Opitutales bacterium]